jgi:hypothetical protein
VGVEILSGLGGAVFGGMVTLIIHRSERSAARLGAMEARIVQHLDRIDKDLNNLGRKVSGIEGVVNVMLDHPERFVEHKR